jgi:hypothetical protein
MMRTSSVGRWITRVFIRLVGITLMLVIGVIQAVGTILTAMSAVILKGISAVMIFVTVLLLIFGLFSWTKTLIVLLIAGIMFWVPDLLAAAIFGLSAMQAKLMDLMDA